MKLATILVLLAVSVLPLSCVSTSVRGHRIVGQESVEFSGLLVYMEAEEVVREQLESVFVHALTMKGVPSETSLVFMNQPRAYSPDEISEIMGQAGLDGFLRVRLEDFHTEGRELHHSGGVYVGPGFFMAHPPRVSYHERTRLSLRLDLFQRPGGPLVWTGRGRARGPGRASLSRLARHLGAKLAHRLFSGRLVTPRAG